MSGCSQDVYFGDLLVAMRLLTVCSVCMGIEIGASMCLHGFLMVIVGRYPACVLCRLLGATAVWRVGEPQCVPR